MTIASFRSLAIRAALVLIFAYLVVGGPLILIYVGLQTAPLFTGILVWLLYYGALVGVALYPWHIIIWLRDWIQRFAEHADDDIVGDDEVLQGQVIPVPPAPAKPLQVVVAGSMGEALAFADQNRWSSRDYVMASSTSALHGLRGPIAVHWVGTWKDRSDLLEIAEAVEIVRSRTGR